MTATPLTGAPPFIVTALVTEEGSLALLMSDDQVIVAGRVIGPAGEKGDRGLPGVKGDRGTDGNTILTVDGKPQPSDGVEGDWAIDRRAMKIYGPKVASGWGRGTDMVMTAASLDAAIKQFNSKSGPGGGRFFGMGAPSAGVAVGGVGGSGSLEAILGNNLAVVANVPTPVAIDTEGDAMIVDLWAQGPQGTLFVEVAVSKGAGTDTGYSVVYEVRMGAVPPVLTFTPGTNAAGTDLQLQVSSDVNLVTLRGRIMKI
jgi:hypothetical protein